MKKLIVFDLDGTLAESKMAISQSMGALLNQLLAKCQVGILGGLSLAEFKTHVVDQIQADPSKLARLHLLPTDGTQYYRYDLANSDWQQVYANKIAQNERQHIATAIEQTAKQLGYWEPNVYGQRIEDRGSQITFSALGQGVVAELGQEGLDLKKAWDPDGAKRKSLRDALAHKLPSFSVHSAGLTSVNVDPLDEDKAAALARLIKTLGIAKTEVVYVGDALAPGGNDAVVREAGFETVAVKSPADTAKVIEKLLAN